jgi:putative oxidoreductase
MEMLMRLLLVKNISWSPLILRLVAGVIFIAYGGQKLFGWYGGAGLSATGEWMASIGLSPGWLMALMAGSVEFFGGIFLMLGLLARPTAIALSITMLVAIFTVHISNGLFMANNGYAFGLALFAMCVSVAISGAGRISIDNLIAEASNNPS